MPFGLASRRFGEHLPPLVAAHAGDTLWAAVVFLLAGAALPRTSITARTLASLDFAFAVEFSQLWHPARLDAIRAAAAGHLRLGRGFLPSDLACHAAGIALAASAEALLRPVHSAAGGHS